MFYLSNLILTAYKMPRKKKRLLFTHHKKHSKNKHVSVKTADPLETAASNGAAESLESADENKAAQNKASVIAAPTGAAVTAAPNAAADAAVTAAPKGAADTAAGQVESAAQNEAAPTGAAEKKSAAPIRSADTAADPNGTADPNDTAEDNRTTSSVVVDEFKDLRPGEGQAITKLTPELGQRILSLYVNPNFAGSFSGSVVFNDLLASDKHIFLPYDTVQKILHSLPEYVQSAKKRFVFPRRTYDVHGFGSVMASDLGFLPEVNGYTAFIVVVDIYSYHLYGKALKSQSGPAVLAAFKEIVEGINKNIPAVVGHVPHALETDRGSEFTDAGFQKYLEQEKIFWRPKFGSHKSSYAEYNVFRIKSRLGILMRQKNTRQWFKFFDPIVHALNFSPSKHIAGLKPGLINSPMDNFIIDQKMGTHVKTPSYEQQKLNQAKYIKNVANLQVGSFVLLDYPKKPFSKSFQMQRSSEMFVIASVDAMLKPPMYRIRNLLNQPISGHYYKQQLRETLMPTPGNSFEIDRLVDEKVDTNTGKKMYLVKYVGYG